MDETRAARYAVALKKELEAAADQAGGRVDTVYLGGGTPPIIGARRLMGIIEHLATSFELAPDAEFTCEANPESLTAEMLDTLLAAGVTRLSLGAQSFDDKTLAVLGRRHDARGAEDAYWRARAAGFDNVSLDLMYGLPGRPLAGWKQDLERALALGPEHLSAYGLTLPPTSELSRTRYLYYFPDDDEQADMYYAAVDTFGAAGYALYETSNFARPGRECRHNIKYWRDGEYLGFGPAAASHFGRGRYRNPPDLDEYCVRAAVGRWPLVDAEPSDPYREMRTAAVLGLRLAAGIDAAAFERATGVNPKLYYKDIFAKYVAAGLIAVAGDNVRLTRRGLYLADEVFAALI
jgi:oxygen-independent coproporphyrinogen-3 oxidase